jgi:hypothetical protein
VAAMGILKKCLVAMGNFKKMFGCHGELTIVGCHGEFKNVWLP